MNALSLFVQQQSEFDETRDMRVEIGDVRLFVTYHLFSIRSRFENVALENFRGGSSILRD